MIRHLFIINPEAGVKSCVAEATERIKRAFILNTDRRNETYDILLTEKKGDATDFVRQACLENPGFTRIYACGGDGTLNEVISGAVGAKDVAIGVVPVGSGNDFVRYFEDVLPRERFLDVSAAVRGEAVPCDVMRCGEIYSLNNISAGLDAVTGRRQQIVKRIPLVSGGAAYKLALGYSFLSSMYHPMRFVIDGEEVTIGKGAVTLAVVGNGRFYGGGFKATPLADISDGLLDFVTIPALSQLQFLKYVSDYKNGRHLETIPEIYFRRVKKIQFLAEKPISLQADGEIFTVKDPEIEVVPAAIRLILPKEK